MKVTAATTYGELASERARLGIVSLTVRTVVTDDLLEFAMRSDEPVDPELVGRRRATARLVIGGRVEVTGADDIEALDNLLRSVEHAIEREARMRAQLAGIPNEQLAALATIHLTEDQKAILGAIVTSSTRSYVCTTCKDTHEMQFEDRKVMCTHCPTPCDECRVGGNGAYCTKTPCACACHAKRRAELGALLR